MSRGLSQFGRVAQLGEHLLCKRKRRQSKFFGINSAAVFSCTYIFDVIVANLS
jgi:hypothetical protein